MQNNNLNVFELIETSRYIDPVINLYQMYFSWE